jgi:hypothetical protein
MDCDIEIPEFARERFTKAMSLQFETEIRAGALQTTLSFHAFRVDENDPDLKDAP